MLHRHEQYLCANAGKDHHLPACVVQLCTTSLYIYLQYYLQKQLKDDKRQLLSYFINHTIDNVVIIPQYQ